MQIFGKFELFSQTFPPTPIYYDPPIYDFQKFSNPYQLFRPPYYCGRESTFLYYLFSIGSAFLMDVATYHIFFWRFTALVFLKIL